jgi:hypothetical protein
MATLHEINETRLKFLEQIESGEIPEEAIADTLDALDGEFEDKANDYASYIKSLLSDAQAIKAEADALNERAKAKKHKAEVLTNYLYQSFKMRGKTKLETPQNVLKIRKNPPSVHIDDESEFIKWAQSSDIGENYLTYRGPLINKTALKNALKSGQEIPHAQLVSSEKLSIK